MNTDCKYHFNKIDQMSPVGLSNFLVNEGKNFKLQLVYDHESSVHWGTFLCISMDGQLVVVYFVDHQVCRCHFTTRSILLIFFRRFYCSLLQKFSFVNIKAQVSSCRVAIAFVRSKLGLYSPFNSRSHIGTGSQYCHLWKLNPTQK